MAACELTHLARRPIDLERARAQHRAYEQALARAGCRVDSLPALDDLPDSVFVEDVAIVLDEIAIVTRPGAESRRPETAHIAPVLAQYRRVIVHPGARHAGRRRRAADRPAHLRRQSGRSNESGIEQLRAVAWPYGYTVTGVPVSGCLHLKSAITEVAPGVVLVNPAWVDAAAFGHVSVIDVDSGGTVRRQRPAGRRPADLPGVVPAHEAAARARGHRRRARRRVGAAEGRRRRHLLQPRLYRPNSTLPGFGRRKGRPTQADDEIGNELAEFGGRDTARQFDTVGYRSPRRGPTPTRPACSHRPSQGRAGGRPRSSSHAVRGTASRPGHALLRGTGSWSVC